MSKKIAIVFSGGGTKGVYSAGVTNAIMQVGLKPDVLTGSSIGAINTVLLAEMLLSEAKPGKLAEYLSFWEGLSLDAEGKQKILSSGYFSPLVLGLSGGLVGLALSHLGITFYWANGILALVNLGLAGGLLYKWYGPNKGSVQQQAKRSSYIKGISKLFNTITLGRFKKGIFSNRDLQQALIKMGIPENRTFKDYQQQQLYVACTRTNLRTGKKEISEYLPSNEQRNGDGRVIGNPYVIPACLASSAYPLALPPIEASTLYNPQEPDNTQLYAILETRNQVKNIFRKYFGYLLSGAAKDTDDNEEYRIFMEQLGLWELRRLEDALNLGIEGNFELYVEKLMPQFLDYYINKRKVELEGAEHRTISAQAFVGLRRELQPYLTSIWRYRDYPRCGKSPKEYSDCYIDGGVVDNTPLSLALAKLKDLQVTEALVLVVFLNPPRLDFWSQQETEEAKALEIGYRGLTLSDSANMINDIKSVGRVNALLRKADLRGEVLKQLSKLNVKVKSIFPEQKHGWTFAVDERFGYNRTLQRKIITTGCKNTLETLLQVQDLLPELVRRKLALMIQGEGSVRQCKNTSCPYYPKGGKGEYTCDGKIFFCN